MRIVKQVFVVFLTGITQCLSMVEHRKDSLESETRPNSNRIRSSNHHHRHDHHYRRRRFLRHDYNPSEQEAVTVDNKSKENSPTLFSNQYDTRDVVLHHKDLPFENLANFMSKSDNTNFIQELATDVDLTDYFGTTRSMSLDIITPTSLPSSKTVNLNLPSATPSITTTKSPTSTPSITPTKSPTTSLIPTTIPTENPTPSIPTVSPTSHPSVLPTKSPSTNPSDRPSTSPSSSPSVSPSVSPSLKDSSMPSSIPSLTPSSAPSSTPSILSSSKPSSSPSAAPSLKASSSPSLKPSTSPSMQPSLSEMPSNIPSSLVCTDLTRSQRAAGISNIVSSITDTAELNDTNSPQYQALQWVTNLDALQLCPNTGDNQTILQRYILATFYFSTNGQNWKSCNDPNAPTQNPCPGTFDERFLSGFSLCTWYGISCNNFLEGIIRRISLDDNNLVGSIPSEIAALSELTHFSLEGPQTLVGTIPSVIGNLSSLQVFEIDTNQITGTIPASFYSLTNLRTIDIDDNKLTGTINWSAIAAFPSLTFLAVGGNSITSTILPSELSKLSGLESLDLNNLGFTGGVPNQWQNFNKLTAIDLSSNNISGPIPSFFDFSKMPELNLLLLDNNTFTGTIPPTLSTLRATLSGLTLDNNQITSIIPTEIGLLTLVSYMSLNDNVLTGPIPSEIGLMSALEFLSLENNQLTGSVPEEICTLVSSGVLLHLSADCDPNSSSFVNCSCCTECPS